MTKLTVAVVGATGAVGREMIKVLEQRKFPVKALVPLATARKQKRKVRFRGNDLTVRATNDRAFSGVDLTLFAGGGTASQEFAWEAVRRGSLVIDNSSTFRMRPDVPLIVPEVNPDSLRLHRGLIANPNCSTIQMVVVLNPICRGYGISRVVVSTYQSVSGTGRDAIEELRRQAKALLEGRKYAPKVYPRQIAFNALPHIDVFEDNQYTKEEMKMVNETRKIFSDPRMKITATAVRVPVFVGHAESINVETVEKADADEVRKLLKKQRGVVVVDDRKPTEGDPNLRTYPLPVDAAGRDEVFVGRIREDISVENGIALWCVSDNLRKGAALNAVQIAELLF
ncbi:MAG: aspartate-semialdehyde dehydrogenase [bacterium]